jgi:hypothetical protein
VVPDALDTVFIQDWRGPERAEEETSPGAVADLAYRLEPDAAVVGLAIALAWNWQNPLARERRRPHV